MTPRRWFLNVMAILQVSLGPRLLKIARVVALSFLFLTAVPAAAEAASLFLSPASGTHAVGSTFTMSVLVSSPDQPMNGADGVVNFPEDKLEIVSLSKGGSVFGLWVKEPSFSNTNGTVNFEGIVLNPGFQGSSRGILTMTFKAREAGSARVFLSSASVLANDGEGTNILSGLGEATISLVPQGEGVPSAPSVPTPRIVSGTHPDQTAWYASPNAEFTWAVPAGVDAVRLLVGVIPNATPTVIHAPPITSKTVKDLTDGIWYFNAQFRKGQEWGPIARYKVQIDTEYPESFIIREIHSPQAPDGTARFAFEAKDRTSGIAKYEVKIDGGEPVMWIGSATDTYVTPPVAPGQHILSARAYDRAGHWSEADTTFLVEVPPVEHVKDTQPTKPLTVETPAPPSQSVPLLYVVGITAVLMTLLLIALYLFISYEKRRLELKEAIDTARHDINEAFRDLNDGTSMKETEKRVNRAINDISRHV